MHIGQRATVSLIHGLTNKRFPRFVPLAVGCPSLKERYHQESALNQRHQSQVEGLGNHDMALIINDKAKSKLGGVMYVEDISTCSKIFNGKELNVCGNPWTRLLVSWL